MNKPKDPLKHRFLCIICGTSTQEDGVSYWTANERIGTAGWRILPRKNAKNDSLDFGLHCDKCAT